MQNNRTSFQIKSLIFSVESTNIIRDISVDIEEGKITSIIGPNGSGKSTLLQLLTKNYKRTSGDILIKGNSIDKIKGKEFAREVAIVNQDNTPPLDTTVRKLVSYGRIPYKKISLTTMDEEDEKVVDWALEITGLTELAGKDVSSLSGGQRQRAWIAMSLAQKTGILFLDEPTTYLDIKYQMDILNIVKELNEIHNITIVMVLHDINQAIKYSHNIIAMKDGKIHSVGNAKSMITPDLVEDIYQVKVDTFEIDGIKYIVSF